MSNNVIAQSLLDPTQTIEMHLGHAYAKVCTMWCQARLELARL